MSRELDAIVVGAGAAGLAAGARLHQAGVRVAVLEAAPRIGGRAFTDTESFGVPWDRGCHWLHSASVNPLRALADELGVAYAVRGSRQARATHLGRRWADEDEREAAWAAIHDAFAAIKRAGDAGLDVPASVVADLTPPWGRLARHWIGLMSAAEPEALSTLDFAAYDDTGENYPVEKGYGALIAAVAAHQAPDLEVTCGCPVTRIDWSGRAVAVETPRGTAKAQAVIVAVPTSVVAKGALAFAPALPADLVDAFAALPLGAAEKVVFRFDRDLFGPAGLGTGQAGFEPTTYFDTLDLDDAARRPINFTLNPFGHPMAIGQLAGENAARLVAAGPEAMVDFGRAALVDAFGSDIGQRIIGAATTGWVADPFIGGGYSCALPGKAHLRARLSQVLGERVFFAGEAVSARAYSTAHGAHQTGLAAADAVLERLGRRLA